MAVIEADCSLDRGVQCASPGEESRAGQSKVLENHRDGEHFLGSL